jgi:hypothetical protein
MAGRISARLLLLVLAFAAGSAISALELAAGMVV